DRRQPGARGTRKSALRMRGDAGARWPRSRDQLPFLGGSNRQAFLRARRARRPALRGLAGNAAGSVSYAPSSRPPDSAFGRGGCAQSAGTQRAAQSSGASAARDPGVNARAGLAELGAVLALAVAVIGSGLWLIRAEHDARQRF